MIENKYINSYLFFISISVNSYCASSSAKNLHINQSLFCLFAPCRSTVPCINERNVRCNWIQANILKRTTGLWVHYTEIYIWYIYLRFVYPWTLVFISVSAALTFAAAASILLQYSRWQLEKFIEPTCGRLSPATLRAAFPAIMTPLIFEPSSRWKCCQSSECAGCCSRQSAGKRLQKGG